MLKTIKLTEVHLHCGEIHDTGACPVYLAIRPYVVPDVAVNVFANVIVYNGPGCVSIVENSFELEMLIHSIDNGADIEPCEFQVNIPDGMVKP